MLFSKEDDYFMKLALQQAEQAFEADEVPVGALLVCNGQIIARAHNYVELLNDCTAHAEMQIITAGADYIGGKYLTDCTLYVTLEPCVMCAGALYWSQISRIVYGASEPKRGALRFGSELFHPKTQIIGGILEHECAEIIKRFFEQKRN
jgi:tRNA(adenine34) deaminase